MSAPPTLVFDLDGTLSDPADGIGRSINHALAAQGCRLGVCTSKRVDFAERILHVFGLRASGADLPSLPGHLRPQPATA
ncbi:MAG: hypothetical protein LCH73_09355 [Proteobacteria bacterium]|nr:hypothetical protein [Pseudomonadota bacterium]